VGTITSTYNAANQLASTSVDTTTWTYDAAGNQTRNGITAATATYGDRGETTTLGGTNFDYYGPGNTTRTEAGTRDFTTTALGLDTQNATSVLGYSYKSDGTAIGYTGTNEHYYITDSLGSVVGMFSQTGTYDGGYSYSPYGEARSTGTSLAVTTNTQRYIGGYQEAANIYKLGARYYDATTGRFTQMDPSGQESHPYAYVACNPINSADPSGLDTCGFMFLIVGILVASAVTLAGFTLGVSLLVGAVASVAVYVASEALCP
jgi:RHS repeat-associated protein